MAKAVVGAGKRLRSFLLSYQVLKYVKMILLNLNINLPSINAKIENQMRKLDLHNSKSNDFNFKLLKNFNGSSKAKMIFDDLYKGSKENLLWGLR